MHITSLDSQYPWLVHQICFGFNVGIPLISQTNIQIQIHIQQSYYMLQNVFVIWGGICL